MQPESLKKPVSMSLRKGSGSRDGPRDSSANKLGGVVPGRMMGSPKTSGLQADYQKKLSRMNQRLDN